MKFHLPSFALGFGTGYAARVVAEHFRPVLLELATAGFRLAGALTARAIRVREDVEDVLSEARARASAKAAATPTPPLH